MVFKQRHIKGPHVAPILDFFALLVSHITSIIMHVTASPINLLFPLTANNFPLKELKIFLANRQHREAIFSRWVQHVNVPCPTQMTSARTVPSRQLTITTSSCISTPLTLWITSSKCHPKKCLLNKSALAEAFVRKKRHVMKKLIRAWDKILECGAR